MLLGYVEFLALLFLPGATVLALFNQVAGVRLVSFLARAYGLSLALNSLLAFALASEGVSIFSLAPLVSAVSAVGIAVLIWRLRKSITGGVRSFQPSRASLASTALLLLTAALVLSQFAKYPIFPKTYSVDFVQHVMLLQSMMQGPMAGAQAIFYYGVHYNLALGLILVGGDPFVQTRILVALLSLPSSFLIYEVCMVAYKRERAALLGQALYAVTGFLWYVPLFDSGLYPNLYGIFLSLAFVVELREALDRKGLTKYAPFAVLSLGLYLSHYFTVVFMAAMLLSLLVVSAIRLESFRRTVPLAVIMLAPASLVALKPDVVSLALSVLGQTGQSGLFAYTTPLADAFSFSPFSQYVIAEVFGYGGLVLFFGLPLAAYYAWVRRRETWLPLMLLAWFIILWATTPPADIAWRFAFQALAPMLLLGPATFEGAGMLWRRYRPAGSSSKMRRYRGRSSAGRRTQVAALLVILLVVFAGSWTSTALSDLSSGVSSYAQGQNDLYQAMVWFSNNTPQSAKLVSTTDWRISFLNIVTGRFGGQLLFYDAPTVVSAANGTSYRYILVTTEIPSEVPAGFNLTVFYQSYSQDSNLTQVYHSGYDTIYAIR